MIASLTWITSKFWRKLEQTILQLTINLERDRRRLLLAFKGMNAQQVVACFVLDFNDSLFYIKLNENNQMIFFQRLTTNI